MRNHVFDHAFSHVFSYYFFIWSIWFFFLFMSVWPQNFFWNSKFWKKKIFSKFFFRFEISKNLFFNLNFMLRLILHAKITTKHEVKIYENNFDRNFYNCSWLNSIFEIWWFMKNVKFSSISVSNWFDDFFRSIHSDVLTLMIFVLMKRFKTSQKIFLIITSTELFFSFIHLISIISRFL